LIRLQWYSDARAAATLAEADGLSSQLAAAHAEIARVEGAARAANEQLDALRNTRRYRLACRIASPLDRMRGRLGVTR
jgi:hypothetical protein